MELVSEISTKDFSPRTGNLIFMKGTYFIKRLTKGHSSYPKFERTEGKCDKMCHHHHKRRCRLINGKLMGSLPVTLHLRLIFLPSSDWSRITTGETAGGQASSGSARLWTVRFCIPALHPSWPAVEPPHTTPTYHHNTTLVAINKILAGPGLL